MGSRRKSLRRRQRGAALVIVIAIMAILLAIALTFFRVTSEETKVAQNVSSTVRGDLISDAGIALAIASLNQDVHRHPEATSTDHAWRSTFNGAWAVGKEWALLKDYQGNAIPLEQHGIPEINLNAMPDIEFEDGWRERLYRGERTRDWLYIPRIEGNYAVKDAATDEWTFTNAYPQNLHIFYLPVKLDDTWNVVQNFALYEPGTNNDVTNNPGFEYALFPIDEAGNILHTFYSPTQRLLHYARFAVSPIHSTMEDIPADEAGGYNPYTDVHEGYPYEQVHNWTDVDNDGDGFRDSIWLPVPQDKFFSLDHVGGAFAIDNNLDGVINEPNEPGVFVYWGGADGLDNDGDGLVDQADSVASASNPTVEYDPRLDDPAAPLGTLPADNANLGFFLTAPLPGLRLPVDLDGDGIPNDTYTFYNNDGSVRAQGQLMVRIPDPIWVDITTPSGVHLGLRMYSRYVDTIDNDYDMLANDYFTYVYLDPSGEANPDLAYTPIKVLDRAANGQFPLYVAVNGDDETPVIASDQAIYEQAVRITHSGEPVCDLAGRVAVLINDEASKVNVNAAGGHNYNEFWALPNPNEPPIKRSLGDGAHYAEYETRTLPDIGDETARDLWASLLGQPKSPASADVTGYELDVNFPGYGRADDNANAFITAFNGRDDDGDGLIDEGVYLPPLSALAATYLSDPDVLSDEDQVLAIAEIEKTRFNEYFNRLGLFEGIDEPGELQRYRPQRNLGAEGDGVDNDGDGVTDEFGELGDRQFQNREQLTSSFGIGDTTRDILRPLLTTHSSDRNVGYLETDEGLRALNRLDFNFATPQQIAAHLMIHANLFPVTERGIRGPGESITREQHSAAEETLYFAQGLRQADMHLGADQRGGGYLYAYDQNNEVTATTRVLDNSPFPADPQLQAMQIGVDAVDSRDADHARSILITETTDAVADYDANDPYENSVPWPEGGDLNLRETTARNELMALEEVEDHMRGTLGIGSASQAPRMQAVDDWWDMLVSGATDGNGDAPGEQRHISYATSGNEAIRINELMVRPVRRVEAEIDNNVALLTPNPAPYDLVMPGFDVVSRTYDSDYARINFHGLNTDASTTQPWFLDSALPTPSLGGLSGVTKPVQVAASGYVYTICDDDPNDIGGCLSSSQIQVPDTIQYMFRESSGLPSGRYYLTANVSVDGAAPSPAALATPLRYSVKYVHVTDSDIVDDWALLVNGLNLGDSVADFNAATAADAFDNFRLTNWQSVPAPHIASRPGEPQGWVFLDGTPKENRQDGLGAPLGPKPVPGYGYFREFEYATDFVLTDTQVVAPAAAEAGASSYARAWLSDRAFADSDTDGIDDLHFDTLSIEVAPGSLTNPQTLEVGFGAIGTPGAIAWPVITYGGGVIDLSLPDHAAVNNVMSGLLFVRLNGSLGSIRGQVVEDPSAPVARRDTNTVTIPPADSGYALCVAIENPVPGQTLSVNFFDFSQEPDHEWVELANVSDEEVDISGWELEVGIPDTPGVLPDPFKSLWRVPEGTVVAPGGMALLSFESSRSEPTRDAKFDRFRAPILDNEVNKFAANGMGLARGGALGGDPTTTATDVTDVTVPPIADLTSTIDPDPAAGDPYRLLYDPTGSVFARYDDLTTENFNEYRDYLDRDGDGVSSAGLVIPERTALLENEGLAALNGDLRVIEAFDTDDVFGEGEWSTTTGGSEGGGNKPWDRIVPMENRLLETDPSDPSYPYGGNTNKLMLYDVRDVDDVARMVLRGGALPNYPEHDRIDNDGDGGYFNLNGTYIRGTLEKDMVDNDLDGRIDERPYEVDGNPLLGATYGVGIDPAKSEGVDEGALGYGRFFGAGSFEPGTVPIRFFNNRDLQRESLLDLDAFDVLDLQVLGNDYASDPASVLPYDFGLSGEIGLRARPDGVDPPPYVRTFGFPLDPGSTPSVAVADTIVYAYNANTADNEYRPYLGSDGDPPDWKAFAERRWYPGDNVMVTLYAGPAAAGAVADRVTYREYDVINRTIDDVVENPYYADLDGSGDIEPALGEWFGLNADYPTLWAPNHMGLDFYRSLERKHPLYNGDRFGTQNRWQATDGNYDDWSESLSWFERQLVPSSGLPRSDSGGVEPYWEPRLTSGGDIGSWQNNRKFGHAMYGTPLRMNTAQRYSENPKDFIKLCVNQGFYDFGTVAWDDADTRHDDQFPGLETYTDPESRESLSLPKNLDWTHAKAEVRDDPFGSMGDLLRLPHLVVNHTMLNPLGANLAYRYVRDWTLLNSPRLRLAPVTGNPVISRQHVALRGAILGQDETDAAEVGNLLSQSADMMSLASITLSVGQADFTPLNPGLALYDRSAPAVPFTDSMLYWGEQSGAPLSAPAAWSPVFLMGWQEDADTVSGDEWYVGYPGFPDGAGDTAALRFEALFNGQYFLDGSYATPNAFFGALPNVDALIDRWPLARRAMFFVAEEDGDNTTPPAEALFTWDGEDGLENGEYMLYIGTYTPDISRSLLTAVDALGSVSFNPAVPTGNADLTILEPPDLPFLGTDTDNGVVAEAILAMDPQVAPVGTRRFEPRIAVDVITDPARARGVLWSDIDSGVGLVHPEAWAAGPENALPVGSDGYAFYGNSLWQPIPVRVTDNFLSLRVRNVGQPGQVAAVSHVVLAPRKRVPGKINVNTTRDQVFVETSGNSKYWQIWNALLGLPGVVDVMRTVASPPDLPGAYPNLPGPPYAADADIALVNVITDASVPTAPALPPGKTRAADPQPDDQMFVPGPDYPVPFRRATDDTGDVGDILPTQAAATDFNAAYPLAAQRLSNLISQGRTEHADGRYYKDITDLTRDANGFLPPQYRMANTPGYENTAAHVYPLSNEDDDERRFDEVAARFARMANLVTTRSDVFEILVTAQAGYGVDINGDGRINYRSPDEFVTTAENRTRVVYERRSPSDQSSRPSE